MATLDVPVDPLTDIIPPFL